MRNIKLKEWMRNKLVQFIMLDKVQEHLLQEINRLDKRSFDMSQSVQILRKNVARDRDWETNQ